MTELARQRAVQSPVVSDGEEAKRFGQGDGIARVFGRGDRCLIDVDRGVDLTRAVVPTRLLQKRRRPLGVRVPGGRSWDGGSTRAHIERRINTRSCNPRSDRSAR